MTAANSFTYATMVFAIVGTCMTGNIGAFAPIHRPSTARLTVPLHTPPHYPASATALQANLFDRFFRVSKASANSILQRFEDPEKIMAQALEDMGNDLVRVRQTYAEVTAAQRRLSSSKQQLESQAVDWYNRAQLALKKSNEGLAREALARREALLNQAKDIQDQIDAQASNIDALYEGMGALERKITEANSKKDQMKARVRTAKTTQKANDMVSGLTGRTSMDAFNRMEEKVLALEAAAEVSADMAKNTMNKALTPSSSNKGSASDIEMQFRLLEASDSVDNELEKLVAKILPSSSSKKSVAVERIVIEDSTMDR
jgi:phage shock protein A